MPMVGAGGDVEVTPKLLKIKPDPITEQVPGASAVTSETVTWLMPGPAQSIFTGLAEASDPIATNQKRRARWLRVMFTAKECLA